jgi:hypothetical protein
VLRSSEWLAWVIVAYLLVAAVFEFVLAVRHSISPDGEGWILLVALVAMLVGTVLLFLRVRSAGLLAPAAAFFVIARFYTGDPYYEPGFRAYGDGGVFSPAWIFGLLAFALLAGIATHHWRRTAPVESAAVLLLLVFTALFMGTGH